MALDTLLLAKITYILGIINIIGLVLVGLSCRCILGLKMQSLRKSNIFMNFYKYHCYYWLLFIISVILHTVFAFITFGNPFFQKVRYMKKFWRCYICNDIHYGMNGPKVCPTCLAENAYVEIEKKEAKIVTEL